MKRKGSVVAAAAAFVAVDYYQKCSTRTRRIQFVHPFLRQNILPYEE
jgi:hypothetical protein